MTPLTPDERASVAEFFMASMDSSAEVRTTEGKDKMTISELMRKERIGYLEAKRRVETSEQMAVRSNPLLVPTCYQPEIWQVEKNVIYASIPAVEAGLEYAKELLAAHDRDLGRTTLKNKTWAETIEADIRHMTRTLEMLRACGTNEKGEPR
jgi:hypothetical protein